MSKVKIYNWHHLGMLKMVLASDYDALRTQRDELVKALEGLIDMEGPQPGTRQWADKVTALLKRIKEQP